jgi:hypothetical protein
MFCGGARHVRLYEMFGFIRLRFRINPPLIFDSSPFIRDALWQFVIIYLA